MITRKDIETIKNNRLAIMGISALWIIFFHFTGNFRTGMLEDIRLLGYAGVDIFMFISGIGIYESYVVKGERKIREFYKRRFLRIVPEYVVFMIVGLVIDNLYKHISACNL